MLYCPKCAEENDWPYGILRCHGRCEICQKVAECHEMPSWMLPMLKPKEKEERPSDHILHE